MRLFCFVSGLSLFGVLATGCALEWEEREQQGEHLWQSRCFPNVWFHDTTGSHHIFHDVNWVAGAQVQFPPSPNAMCTPVG